MHTKRPMGGFGMITGTGRTDLPVAKVSPTVMKDHLVEASVIEYRAGGSAADPVGTLASGLRDDHEGS